MAALMMTPLYCDDLNYARGWYLYGHGYNFAGAVAKHWEWVNGRLPNLLLACVLRVFPHWLVCLLNAAATVTVFALALRLMRCRTDASGMLALLVMVTLLPWWDNFMMLAISANYVWSMALGLAFVAVLKLGGRPSPAAHTRASKESGRPRPHVTKGLRQACNVCGQGGDEPPGRPPSLLAVAVAILAGMMHESMSVSILAGIAVYAVVNRLTRRQRMLAVAFLLGSLVPLTSPALWTRTADTGIPDGSPLKLLIMSSSLVVVMLCVTLWLLLANRQRLKDLCCSSWTFYAVGASVSAAIVLYSGSIGRSGFFGQVFALIAVAQMLRDVRIPAKKAVTLVGAALIVTHYASVCIAARHLGNETREITRLYLNSPDGVVYAPISDAVADCPLLLGKVPTPPRPGEVFKTWCFSRYYGDEDKLLLVTPPELRDTDRWQDYSVVNSPPSGVGAPLQPVRSSACRYVGPDGRRYTVTPMGTRGYLVAPWHETITTNF